MFLYLFVCLFPKDIGRGTSRLRTQASSQTATSPVKSDKTIKTTSVLETQIKLQEQQLDRLKESIRVKHLQYSLTSPFWFIHIHIHIKKYTRFLTLFR